MKKRTALIALALLIVGTLLACFAYRHDLFHCAGGHIETDRGTFVIESSPCDGKEATLLEPAGDYVGSRRP